MRRVLLPLACAAVLSCDRGRSIAADDAATDVLDDGLSATLDEATADRRLTVLPRDSGSEQIAVHRVGAAPPGRCRADDEKCVWRFDGWILRTPFTRGAEPVYRCTVHAVTGDQACGPRGSWEEKAPGEFDIEGSQKALEVAGAPPCGAALMVPVYFAPNGTVARVVIPPHTGAAIASCVRAKLSTARIAPFVVPRVTEYGVGCITH